MRRQNWKAAFDAFDLANPGLYQEFRRRACYHRSRGVMYLTASFLLEEMRVYSYVSTQTDMAMPEHLRSIRLNNNYRPYLVDKLIREDSTFADFFLRRDRKWSLEAMA